MMLTTKPRITVMNERKIHVSRKPGFTAWLFLTLSAIIFIGISQRLTENFLYLIVLVLGEIMFSLDAFGEWQDLILDKEENKAVITKYTWTDKVSFKVSQNSCISMKLSDIRHVGVSIEMGLFILHRNGKTTSLSMQGFTREELQELKREINYFLNMNQIESLDNDTTNTDKLFLVRSSLDYLYRIPKKQLPMSMLREVPISINTLRNCKIQYPVHQNLSLPILNVNRQKKKHRQFSTKKGLYTEKSMNFNYAKYV